MPGRDLKRVLFAEDEADIREIIDLALATVGGLELRPCASGEEAIEAATAFRPDLILLDVMMPGLDGPTTLARLRARPDVAGIPAVFMTAKAQRHEVERFVALGAADVIAKPFDPMTLAGQLRAIWRRLPD
jgi:CheY-like chemotaxis protein